MRAATALRVQLREHTMIAVTASGAKFFSSKSISLEEINCALNSRQSETASHVMSVSAWNALCPLHLMLSGKGQRGAGDYREIRRTVYSFLKASNSLVAVSGVLVIRVCKQSKFHFMPCMFCLTRRPIGHMLVMSLSF